MKLSTSALALFALAVLIAACGAPAPAAAPARAPAQVETATSVWRVVGKVGPYDVDLTIYQDNGGPVATASATPAATLPAQTASPTFAATTPLTNTPRPTLQASVTLQFTPSPTTTPVYTLTPDASPTPPATSTPGTSTPAPDGKVCEAVVAIPGGINIRAAASTTSTIKSKAPQGTRVVVQAFQKAGGYLWATVANGYMVVGQYIDPFAWWVSFNSNEFCDTKPGWDFAIPAPPEVATVVKVPIFAFHAVPGANINEMIEAGRVLLAADIPFRR